MSRTTTLMKDWRGQATDVPRDRMTPNQVWLMQDWLPRELGSALESRNAWAYRSAKVYDGYITAQRWVNTSVGSHHLVLTPATLWDATTPGSERVVAGMGGSALNPMAQLFEFICIPRVNALPVFIQYPQGAASETPLITDGTTPQARLAETWNTYFVLANASGSNPDFRANRIYFLGPGFKLQAPGAPTTTPKWDANAWIETSGDVTALARTRNALMIFHRDSVERLRGSIPPGTDRDDDVWIEPLIGLGGCREPHTVAYWNDNVLFADARGVYITNGSEILDVTRQGNVAREWRHAYQPQYRLCGGVYGDYYVVCMVDVASHTFVKCGVCSLRDRSFLMFSNVPCTSIVTTTGENEALYGGTHDNRVIDLTKMWDDVDLTVDTVDGNGTPVLPQLETAWYRITANEAIKRVKNVLMSLDLDESAGSVKVYGCEQVQPRTSADWVLLKTLRMADIVELGPVFGYVRRVIPYGHESYGFSFKVETTGRIRNFKLYDFAIEGPMVREEAYAA